MIRETQESDFEEVFNLIHSAFSKKAESNLVKQLISDGEVLINLVVELSDTIVGNVVVSPITMEPDMGLFCGAVGPLSVLPDFQSSGIGSQLMKETIKKSKEMKKFKMAEWTGLEPATPGVTGRYSNQLNYRSTSSMLSVS